jgi:hypothetical protein
MLRIKKMSVGRNDPCPCGSELKYKKCCLDKSSAQAKPLDFFWHKLHSSRNELIQVILKHARTVYGGESINQAWCEFHGWNDDIFDPESDELPLFMPWFFYNWTVFSFDEGILDTAPDDTPPAKSLLNSKQGRYLEALQREYIEECLKAPFSFFDIVSCQPGQGFQLKDIFTGKVFDVVEKMGSEHARIGDIVFGKAVTIQNLTTMEAMASFFIKPKHKDLILQLRKDLEQTTKPITIEILRDFEIELIDLYQEFYDHFLNPPMPSFSNTDGDPFVPQKVFFEIPSAQKAFELLADLNFIEAPEGLLKSAVFDDQKNLMQVNFAWLKKGNKRHKAWSNTVFGHIFIDKTSLRVEVNSEKRGKLFRKIFSEKFGDTGRYKSTVVESLESKLGEGNKTQVHPQKSEAVKETLQIENHPELQATLKKVMTQHWDNWVNEKVPALNNKTPIQAVKTKDGREMTHALLTQFEREAIDRPRPGADLKTFKKIREKLGL